MELINAIADYKASDLDNIIATLFTYKTGKIIFTGIGKNSFVAAKEAATYSSIGLSSFFVDAVHMVHGDFGMVGPDDIIVALSKSGDTSELVHTLKYLKENIKVSSIVTVDFNENSKMAQYADFAVHLPSVKEMDEWNKVPTNSILFLQWYLDNLGIQAMKKSDFELDDFVLTHPGGTIGQTEVHS